MENFEKNYVGIDISKHKFNFAFTQKDSKKYQKGEHDYSPNDMENFLKLLPKNAHCVMEFTGTYHLRLLYFLQKNNINTSVVKGEKINLFFKIKGKITKSDSHDAVLLCEYANVYQPEIFKIPSDNMVYLKQKRTLLDQLQKQRTFVKNAKEAILQYPVIDNSVLEMYDKMATEVEQRINQVQSAIEKEINADENNKKQLENILKIPGVGKITAITFINLLNIFQGFEEQKNSKAFVKFVGLSPTLHESGTSVKKKSKLSKVSHSNLKEKLFMASLSVCKDNTKDNIFKKYYNKLLEKGKQKKTALVAVMHKMVRIMFAVVKSGKSFDEKLYGKKPENLNFNTK